MLQIVGDIPARGLRACRLNGRDPLQISRFTATDYWHMVGTDRD